MLIGKIKSLLGFTGFEVDSRKTGSSVVYMSLPVVYVIFMIIDYESYSQLSAINRFDVLVVPFTILLCFFCLWLNSINRIKLSRLLFLCLWPFLLHIIPVWIHNTPPDYYVAFPLGIIFHAILIQVMISRKKEPILFWPLLALNFLSLLVSPKVLLYFVAPGDIPNPLVFDPYYLIDIILYWLLFNLVMFYGLLAMEHYIKQVNGARIKIERQKEELTQLNQNLENMVHERTKILEDQNKKLVNYAFYNAHMLRAPFCRIQGLVQLIELTSSNDAPIDNEIEARLTESVAEMEQVIEQMRQIVHSEISEYEDPETEKNDRIPD
ncbi:MAG: hypothetical protein U5K79_10325 [Cyclobacteriaceae bacterium]|nr:hypothetical protein [Cyclobacteriaceae bacterium]